MTLPAAHPLQFLQGEIDRYERIALVQLAIAFAWVEHPGFRGGDRGLVKLAIATGFFYRHFLRRSVDTDQHLEDALARMVLAHRLRRILRRPHAAIADVLAR